VAAVTRGMPVRHVRAGVAVAIAGSAMAGLIHVRAAVAHQGDASLAWMFGLCAGAQLAWAVALLMRRSEAVLAAGVVLNGGAVVFWALSRTSGIGVVDSLAEPQAVGTQDLAAALFAAVSAAACLVMLLRPDPRRMLSPAWTATLGAVALIAATPALAAGHSHDHTHAAHVETGDGHSHGGDEQGAAHDHGDADDAGEHGHEDADASHAHGPGSDAHDHGVDVALAASAHGHGDTGGDGGHAHTSSTGGDGGHVHAPGTPPESHPPGTHPPGTHPPGTHPPDPTEPTGPIISLTDPRLTPAQRAAAQQLIDVTRAGMARFSGVASLTAAGYASIGDGATGYEHFVNWSYLTDAYELDPNRIESVVVQHSGGVKTIVSAMYILSLGKTMADVPDIAGALTTWHDHQNLCWDLATRTVVGVTVNGVCQQGVFMPTPPMLHVWMVSHPCGPFAAIDEHGVTCGAHGH
jgi:hypothetical protein